MFKYFYVFLFIIAHNFCVETVKSAILSENIDEHQLSPEQLSKIPFLHHHDAREFFTVMKPVFVEYNKKRKLEKRNPYLVYFETMILGQTFGLMTQDKIDENLQSALSKLIHTLHDFNHWTRISNLAEGSDVYKYLSQHILALSQRQKNKTNSSNYRSYSVPIKLIDALENLESNIFACYSLGLMQHEIEYENKALHSKKKQQTSLKKIFPTSAFNYLMYSAEGFCDLALNFVFMTEMLNSDKVRDKIKKIKQMQQIMSDVPQVNDLLKLHAFITYIIQNDIFSKSHMLSFDQKNGLSPIDNMKKLISSLIFDGSPFQKSYQECYDGLYSKMSAERNKSFFSTEDFMWKCTTFCFPALMMGLNGCLLYYADEDEDSKSFKDNFTLLAPKGLFAISTAFVTFNVGAYAMYKRPFFIRLGEDMLKDEIKLISLYLASKPSEQESNKARVEEIFNILYRTAAGFRFNSLPKMSQIAMDYEEQKK